MILNTNLIILFNLIVRMHIIQGGDEYSCFDGSKSDDCACSTGTSGAIGTCTCSPTTVVRQGQQCSYDSVNQVDSVSVSYSIYCNNFKPKP
jgi:hypothetical protein